MEEKEEVAFQCKICGAYIEVGKCGLHRQKTEHDKYEPTYKKAKIPAINFLYDEEKDIINIEDFE